MRTLFKLKECKTIKKDFYVFDTETNGLRAKSDAFIFGVIYGHNFCKILYSVNEFKNEFEDERYKDKKIFAHNASYDLEVIYDNIYKLDPEAIFNGKFICATNGNAIFADSMNIYKTSVKKLGKLMGIEKMELSSEYHTGNVSGKVSKKDIDYCIRDCEIVWKALQQAFEFAGQICITQASLSMAYFRRNHLPFNIQANDNVNYFFNSYYGGRTEAFKIGKTHACVYDVNSMYPFVMKDNKFPNPKHCKKIVGVHTNIFKGRYLKQYEGCAHIELEHDNTWLGFLPYKKDGKLLFPTGKFSGWYNFPEIRFALKEKAIKITKVHEVIYAPPMDSIFTSFVETLYTQRFRTKDQFEIFRIKIYMNSLYGKFGQKIKEDVIYLEDITDINSLQLIEQSKAEKKFIKLQMFSMERQDAFLFISKDKFKQPSYSIPSFASYITTYARLQLLQKLLDCEKYSPVYCDTDSIFVEKELPEKNEISFSNMPVLGDWKKEEKIVTEIRGLKNYVALEKGELKRYLKGVPPDAEYVFDNTLNKHVWKYKNLIKTKEGLRRGIDSGVLTTRTKHIKNTYDKRILLADGNTKPIEL